MAIKCPVMHYIFQLISVPEIKEEKERKQRVSCTIHCPFTVGTFFSQESGGQLGTLT